MAGLIFINGSPGAGKTTTSRLLKAALASPFIELGYLREYHLNRAWSNQSEEEAQMAFENLVFILKNYLKYGFQNVIITDLLEAQIQQIPEIFDSGSYLIFTLVVNDDALLKSRVLDETRDSGFRNYEEALAWNRRERERPLLPDEMRIDNTNLSPEKVVEKILGCL